MNNNTSDKEGIRHSLPCPDLSPQQFGKLAERLRHSPEYTEAKRVFVEPSPALLQVRINALLDQKELLLPSAGLKQGFIRFKPNVISFNKLAHALTFKGMGEFGEIVPSGRLAALEIDLAVIDSEAVDVFGGRLGDGLGFSDISVALLREYGALKKEAKVLSVISENRVFAAPLPSDPWDIRLDGFVTQAVIKYVTAAQNSLGIIWSALPKKRIRKIQPLWDLFCKENPL